MVTMENSIGDEKAQEIKNKVKKTPEKKSVKLTNEKKGEFLLNFPMVKDGPKKEFKKGEKFTIKQKDKSRKIEIKNYEIVGKYTTARDNKDLLVCQIIENGEKKEKKFSAEDLQHLWNSDSLQFNYDENNKFSKEMEEWRKQKENLQKTVPGKKNKKQDKRELTENEKIKLEKIKQRFANSQKQAENFKIAQNQPGGIEEKRIIKKRENEEEIENLNYSANWGSNFIQKKYEEAEKNKDTKRKLMDKYSQLEQKETELILHRNFLESLKTSREFFEVYKTGDKKEIEKTKEGLYQKYLEENKEKN